MRYYYENKDDDRGRSESCCEDEIKLHKRSLKQLLAERASWEKKFTVRNGGMRGLPQSVRKRIERLENVINYKSAILKRVIEENESGSVSEES